MPFQRILTRCVLPLLAIVVWAAPAAAQVNEVVVGITPTCPYGLGACWAGAYAALGQIDGVASVSTVPDTYNCTAAVRMKHPSLPDPDRWSDRFREGVGGAYGFRGVEVTVVGTLVRKGDDLAIEVPGVDRPLRLAPLRHKLQWNPRKEAARGPEPNEANAFAGLSAEAKKAGGNAMRVQITGPLRKADGATVLEVRETFDVTPVAKP